MNRASPKAGITPENMSEGNGTTNHPGAIKQTNSPTAVGVKGSGEDVACLSPRNSLQRFQLGSQPGLPLTRSRWQSESVLGVNTGKETVIEGQISSENVRGTERGGVRLMPTWNPSSRRYIKVNLGKGNFQSSQKGSSLGGIPQHPSHRPEASFSHELSDTDPAIRKLRTAFNNTWSDLNSKENFQGRPRRSSERDGSNPDPRDPYIHASPLRHGDGFGFSKQILDYGLHPSNIGCIDNEAVSYRKLRSQSLYDLHVEHSGLDSVTHGGIKQNLVSNFAPGAQFSQRIQKRDSFNENRKVRQIFQLVLNPNSSAKDGQTSPTSVDKSQPYIVRSTLCYNTSTQTDGAPKAVQRSEISDKSHASSRGVDVGGATYQTSGRFVDKNGQVIHNKSSQTYFDKDFENTNLDSGIIKSLEHSENKGGRFYGSPSEYGSHFNKSNYLIRQEASGFIANTSDLGHNLSSAFSDVPCRDDVSGSFLKHNNESKYNNVYKSMDKSTHLNVDTHKSRNVNVDIQKSRYFNEYTQRRHHIPNSNALNESVLGTRPISLEISEPFHDLSWTSGLGSDTSSTCSYHRSFTSDMTPSRSASFASSAAAPYPSADTTPQTSPLRIDTTYQWKKVVIVNPEQIGHSRLGSDSVFIDDDNDYYVDDDSDNDLDKTLSSNNFELSEKDISNNYHFNKPKINMERSQHFLGFSASEDVSSHNSDMFSSKFRNRLYSDSQTLESIRDRRTRYPTSITPASGHETLADVISKVNENLAKSAQRVSGIRRSSSSIYRSRLKSADFAHQEMNRRETEWTRLRSMTHSTIYSDQGNVGWLSKQPVDSENFFADLRLLSSSTPRASFAERKDSETVAGTLNHTGLSAVAANYTYKPVATPRRHPPPPPQPASTDGPPPPIPPRMNRPKHPPLPPNEGQHSVSLSPTEMLENSRQEGTSPKPRRPINVIPIMKQLGEETGLNNSQINFKDLMMQWNSNSPGKTNIPDELPRRFNKSPIISQASQPQQKQQTKNTPPVISHPKPKLNFASTALRQDVVLSTVSSLTTTLSPSSHISSPSSFTSLAVISSPSTSSSSFRQTEPDTNLKITGSNCSSPENKRDITASDESFSSKSSFNQMNDSNVSLTNIKTLTVSSSDKIPTPFQPHPTDTVSPQPHTKTTNSSENLSINSQKIDSSAFTEINQYYILRNRSSSQSNVLSDTTKDPSFQLSHPFKKRDYRNTNGIVQNSSSHGPNRECSNSVADAKSGHTNPLQHSIEAPVSTRSLIREDVTPRGLEFHDYANTQAPPIFNQDTTKHTTSTSVAGGGYHPPTIDSNDFTFHQKSRLGQQSWNSESALHQISSSFNPIPEMAKDHSRFSHEKISNENRNEHNTKPAPVRPPRPSAQARLTMATTKSSPSLDFDIENRTQTSSSPLPSLHKTTTTSEHESLFGKESQINNQHTSPTKQTSPTKSIKQTSSQNNHTSNVDSSQSLQDRYNQVDEHNLETRLSPHKRFNSHSTNEDSSQTLHDRHSQVDDHNLETKSSQQKRFNSHPTKESSNHRFSPDNIHNTPLPNKNITTNNHSPGKHPPNTDRPIPRSPMHYGKDRSSNLRYGKLSNSVEDLSRPLEDSLCSPRRQSCSNANSVPRRRLNSFSFSKRQPSMEELECDQKAKALADQLEYQDRRLSDALRQTANSRRMVYMDGLFSDYDQTDFNGSLQGKTQTLPTSSGRISAVMADKMKSDTLPRDHQVPFSKEESFSGSDAFGFHGDGKMTNESTELQRHKKELIDRLHKKVEVLNGEKADLEVEINENCLLEEQVTRIVDSRWPTETEREKFRAHLDDLDKIVRLLLNLSGQLARAEDAVRALGLNSDSKMKKLTLDKRERLHAKHEEAKQLKEDINKRSDQLEAMLHERLSDQEMADYNHLVTTRSTLAIKHQELDDEIVLAEQQIVALKRSLPEAV